MRLGYNMGCVTGEQHTDTLINYHYCYTLITRLMILDRRFCGFSSVMVDSQGVNTSDKNDAFSFLGVDIRCNQNKKVMATRGSGPRSTRLIFLSCENYTPGIKVDTSSTVASDAGVLHTNRFRSSRMAIVFGNRSQRRCS